MYSRMKLSNGNLLEVFGSEENAHLLKLFTKSSMGWYSRRPIKGWRNS